MIHLTRRALLASSTLLALAGRRAFAAPSVRPLIPPPLAPPVARVDPVIDTYFGTPVIDRYRWMETFPQTPEWIAWLKGQNDYARSVLAGLPGRAALTAAVTHYDDAGDFAGALPAGARVFVRRLEPGQAVPRFYVRDRTDGPERLVIDPAAERRPGGKPVTLDWAVPSPDGAHVALGLGEGGSEISAAWIFDTTTGARTRITPIRSKGAGWTADGTGFFYYRLRADAVPGTRNYEQRGSCWLHRLGTDPATDVEVFRSGEGEGFVTQEDDSPFVAGAAGSTWLVGVHYLNGALESQVFVAPADDLGVRPLRWRKVARREDGVVGHVLVGDALYLLANGRAPNGELVRVDLTEPGNFTSAKVVLPASEAVAAKLTSARDGVYVHILKDGQGGIVRVDPAGRIETIPPPRSGAIYAVSGSPLVDGIWFGTDDLTAPAATYRVVPPALKPVRVPLEKRPAIDASRYLTERRDVRARDGTMVPVELLRRRDLPRDGKRPTLIAAYGAYGIVLDPGFDPATLAFLDAGGTIVYAHVRGGGEKGDTWHLAGMKATKPNTWRDAIDVAEAMVALGWTAPAHLAIEGTSAGGIMVGRAITERPDLFAAAIGNVGCFDTVRFELTPNGKGNDAEFGTVTKEDEFRGLLAMDSIRAVKPGTRYPAVMLTTGAQDRRVEPWMIGKFAATLQAASTNPAGCLVRVDYDSGHFATDRTARIARSVDRYAFILAHTA